MPGILAQAPHPSPGPGRGRRCTTSPALTARGPAAVSTTRWPASSMAAARPVSSSPARITRTSWPSVAQRRRTSSARHPPPVRRLRAGRAGGPARSSRWSRRTWRSTGCADPPTSSRQVPPASAGPGQATLIPMPTTTAVRRGPGELGLGQDPGQLGPVEQEVVGPFEHRLDPGHLPAGIGPRQRHGPRAQVHVGALAARAEEHRGQQVRPRRRLPAPVEAAPPGGLVVGHGDEALGRALASPITHIRVGGVDLVEPVDVPLAAPHGRHHRVRAIVKVRLREERPACSRRSSLQTAAKSPSG